MHCNLSENSILGPTCDAYIAKANMDRDISEPKGGQWTLNTDQIVCINQSYSLIAIGRGNSITHQVVTFTRADFFSWWPKGIWLKRANDNLISIRRMHIQRTSFSMIQASASMLHTYSFHLNGLLDLFPLIDIDVDNRLFTFRYTDRF